MFGAVFRADQPIEAGRRFTVCRVALALGLSLCAAAPAFAQTPPAATPGAATPSADQKLPVQIEADSGVEWDQNAHVYIARGNAVATRGPSEVHADILIAHYRDIHGTGNTGTNTEIYQVEAEGHVTMRRNDQVVVGDKAIDNLDLGVAVVTGKNLKMTTPTDVVTARDSMEWYDQKQIAVARGDAVAVRNGRTVKGDVLTAYMVKTAPPGAPGAKPGPSGAKPGAPGAKPAAAADTKPGTPARPGITAAAAGPAKPGQPGQPGQPGEESKISRIDAQGHVVVSNAFETGHGDFGVYNAETGIATLIGNVVVERGKDVIRGQRAVMDLNKNISRMLPGGGPTPSPGVASAPHGRVTGLFVRQDQNAQPGQPGQPAQPSNPAGTRVGPSTGIQKP